MRDLLVKLCKLNLKLCYVKYFNTQINAIMSYIRGQFNK